MPITATPAAEPISSRAPARTGAIGQKCPEFVIDSIGMHIIHPHSGRHDGYVIDYGRCHANEQNNTIQITNGLTQ